MYERTNADRFYCVCVIESDGVMGNIFLMSFALGVRISLEYTLTLLHPLNLQSFNQFSHSDTAVQFLETSLSTLALSTAYKLPLADALLFELPFALDQTHTRINVDILNALI